MRKRKEVENNIYNKYSDIIEEMPNKNNSYSEKQSKVQ